jgi:hypothetical protein
MHGEQNIKKIHIILLTEPVDGGTEMVLKLRLSSTCMDVKLPVCTKDTIGMAKKKLQVSKFDNIP